MNISRRFSAIHAIGEDALVTRDHLRQALDKMVLNAFRPVLTSLVVLYLFFSLSHLFVLPPDVAIIMAGVALATSLSCLLLRFALNKNMVPVQRAHLFGTLVIALILLNSALHLFLSNDPLQTTNFLLLVIATGCIFLSASWFALVISVVVICWAVVIGFMPDSPASLHFAFALGSTVFLSATIFIIRIRNLSRLEEYRLRDEMQKAELADALHLAEESNAALEKSNRHLVEARDMANAGNRAKSEFLANMSHELRTPLNAVIGMADILREEKLLDNQREYVEMIQTSGNRLLGIVEDIFDFARIESEDIELKNEIFALRDGMENVHRVFADAAREKELEFTFHIMDDVPDILTGDLVRLRQVLLHLVSNAVKFTSAGSVVVDIICLERSEERAQIQWTVRDTGIGIAAEKCEHIFDAFVQGDNSATRHFGGTGLGLSIAKRLIEAMAGRIWVESKEGEGSAFSFVVELGISPKA